MYIFICYWLVGIAFSLMGCWIHSRCWGLSFAESLFEAWPLWVIGSVLYPIGLDLLLLPKNIEMDDDYDSLP